LAHADDIRVIEINSDVLSNAGRDIDLVVNIGKIMYMELGCHRGMMAKENFTVGGNSYKKVETFNYLGSSLKH
jgi:hypothetical protein